MILETRECDGCGRNFRVLEKSAQRFCSHNCASGTAEPGDLWKRLNASVHNKRYEPGKGMKTPPSEKPKPNEGGDTTKPTLNKKTPIKDVITKSIKRNSTPNAKPERPKTAPACERTLGGTMPETENDTLNKNAPAVIAETQPALLERLDDSLREETLTSMSLLKKSANKLMQLMEESVSETDLDKSKEGVKKVEAHKILQAIQCADALSRTIQTQVSIGRMALDFKQKR